MRHVTRTGLFKCGWLSSYRERVKIPINYSIDGELTDFQVRIAIVKGSGVDGAGTIYLNNVSLNWPYDIRFTSSDGHTLINFWRQEYDAIDGTWVVKVPVIASSGTTDIYLYYGKSNDSDASNIANTSKDGAGHVFSLTSGLNTGFWTTVVGSPFQSIAGVYPAATSGTTVSAASEHYEAFPTIVRDSTGKLYIFYRNCDSDTHGYEASGRVCYRTSTDDGATWSSEVDVTTTSNMDERDPVALVYSNGGTESILLAYFEYDASANCRAYCQIAPISTMSFGDKIALSGTNNRATYGNPVELSNGTILIPLYDVATWKTYVVKSTNDGASWSEILIGTDTTHQITETSLVELKTSGKYSGKVAAITRTEQSPYTFYKSVSTDYGDTWGDYASTSLSPTVACPPDVVRMSNGGISLIFTAGNDIVHYLSEDETATWTLGNTLVNRSDPENKHYAKALYYGGYIYLAWCTNGSTSDVYFNKIKIYPFLRFTSTESNPVYIQGPNVSMPAVVECRIQYLDDESTFKYNTPFGLGRYIADYTTDTVSIQIYSQGGKYCLMTTTGGNRSLSGTGIAKDYDWSIWKIVWASNLAQYFDDGVQKDSNITTNVPSSNMPLMMGRTLYLNAASRCLVDWIFTSKYTVHEPTWADPGNKERL